MKKKILKYISELKATMKWVKEVKREAVSSRHAADVIHNIKQFRRRIDNINTLEEKPPKRRQKSVIFQEQRRIRGEKMKRSW